MNKLLFGLVLLISTSAFSDTSRPIQTDNLKCVGFAGKHIVELTIQAAPNFTKLTLVGTDEDREIVLNKNLRVQSEGTVYIQQVSNELGYNLFLSGEGLDEVLYKRATKHLFLTGNLDLFIKNMKYSLKCEGTLR